MSHDPMTDEEFRELMASHREEAIAIARHYFWPETYPDPRGKFEPKPDHEKAA